MVLLAGGDPAHGCSARPAAGRASRLAGRAGDWRRRRAGYDDRVSPSPWWLPRSLALLTVGAILAMAVTAHVRYVDIQTAGGCLFCVGVLDLVVNLGLLLWARRYGNRLR